MQARLETDRGKDKSGCDSARRPIGARLSASRAPRLARTRQLCCLRRPSSFPCLLFHKNQPHFVKAQTFLDYRCNWTSFVLLFKVFYGNALLCFKETTFFLTILSLSSYKNTILKARASIFFQNQKHIRTNVGQIFGQI